MERNSSLRNTQFCVSSKKDVDGKIQILPSGIYRRMFRGDKSERRWVLDKAGPEWVTPDKVKESGTSTFSQRSFFSGILIVSIARLRTRQHPDEVIRSCNINVTYSHVYTRRIWTTRKLQPHVHVHYIKTTFVFNFDILRVQLKKFEHTIRIVVRALHRKKTETEPKNYGYTIVL